MARSFSSLHEAKIKLKLSELNITAHISALFQATTKKKELQYNFWCRFMLETRNSNRFPKQIRMMAGYQQPINCKMRTHFTIQDSKNVRKTTKKT